MNLINPKDLLEEFKARELKGLPHEEKKVYKENLDYFCEFIDYNPNFNEQDIVEWLNSYELNKEPHRYKYSSKYIITRFSNWLKMWELLEDFKEKELGVYLPPTKSKYMAKLYRFCGFINFNPDFTEQDIVAWLSSDEVNSYNKKYKANAETIINRFSNWLGKDVSVAKKIQASLYKGRWKELDQFKQEKLMTYTERTRQGYLSRLYKFSKFINFNPDFTEKDVLDWFASDQFQSSNPSWQYESKRIIIWFSKWLGKDFSFIKKKKPAFSLSTIKWKLLKDFMYENVEGLSYSSKKAYYYALNRFGKFINYNDNFSKSDVLAYLYTPYFQSRAVATQNAIKKTLRKFLKWQNKDYLYLRYKKRKRVKPLVLPSWDEIKEIIKKARRPMDKAIFILFLETGGRKGEIRNLNIGDITFKDKYASVFFRESKTAQRNIPLIESVPFLINYLKEHPLRDDPKAPLFITFWRGNYRRISDSGLAELIKRNTQHLNKSIHPHLFRHIRLSQLSKLMTPPLLKKLGGWVADTHMTRVYYHITDEDVESKVLSLYGIAPPPEEKDIQIIGIKECPICHHTNSGIDSLCTKCSFPLNVDSLLYPQKETDLIPNSFTTRLDVSKT